jgi:hypothetical protein
MKSDRGLRILTSSPLQGCLRLIKEKSIQLLYLTTVKLSRAMIIPVRFLSIYHVLIFYSEASLTGSGSGGGWSDEPLSTEAVIWSLQKEPEANGPNMREKRLEMKYNAIGKTLSVGTKEFSLTEGNLFIIHMNDSWRPTVMQVDYFMDEQTEGQKVLDYFKSVFPQDGVIQNLKLSIEEKSN